MIRGLTFTLLILQNDQKNFLKQKWENVVTELSLEI